MTQLKDSMTNIKKIRQEIERRRHDYGKRMLQPDGMVARAKFDELTGLLAFIDSLPDETCKDSLQVPETCKENTDSFTDDPEEAAARYERENRESILSSVDIVNAFIAGAKWQANQLLKGSPLPEDTVLFQKGVEVGKRLMMEEAVEGEVFMSFAPGHNQMVMADVDLPTNTKVKLIIVKED